MADAAPPRSLPLHLAWIGLLCGTLLILLGDVLPFRMPFVRPDTLFLCLLEVEIAFLLFVWPLFIPTLGGRVYGEGALLLAASLPPSLVAANVSNVPAGAFIASLALVGALGAFPASILDLGERRRLRVAPWLLLAAFAASTLLPFVRFVAGSEWSWLSMISPFWSAGERDFWAPAAIYGGLAAAAAVAARLIPAKGVAP